MKKVASILSKRLSGLTKGKMNELAEKSTSGQLSSFSAIFGSTKLDPAQEQFIKNLLEKYAPEEQEFDLKEDLLALLSITVEIKAITNQAAILHGQRIKAAQEILKKYRDGAFSAWLISSYGNRQTPYNFLQYYEFYKTIPETLHPQIEAMPRQAIYTLASRKGPLQKKEEIIKNFKGETKQQLITLIRSTFPLELKDKRKEKLVDNAITSLKRAVELVENAEADFTEKQKVVVSEILSKFLTHLTQKSVFIPKQPEDARRAIKGNFLKSEELFEAD